MKLITFIKYSALTVFINGCGTSTNQSANIENYEAKGNLTSQQNIGCIAPSELNSQLTPPDLYNGMVQCIKDQQYANGVYLFALAGTYSMYDTKRVSDSTAHQAHSVLAMNARNSVKESDYNKFLQAVKETFTRTEGLAMVCDRVKEIGVPNYHPTYMIQHGMGAFVGPKSSNGLVSEFDSEKAWTAALNGYLHCDQK